MAQNNFDCLHGTSVRLSEKSGPFQSCRYCIHESRNSGTVLFIGGNPHHAQIVCADCGMHVSWLGRNHLEAMLAQSKGAVA
jgi:hypothetical protein